MRSECIGLSEGSAGDDNESEEREMSRGKESLVNADQGESDAVIEVSLSLKAPASELECILLRSNSSNQSNLG